jgi:hypothetical protein
MASFTGAGRMWIMFGSRENSKREKCSKSRTVPLRPVHALLGVVLFITRCECNNIASALVKIHIRDFRHIQFNTQNF